MLWNRNSDEPTRVRRSGESAPQVMTLTRTNLYGIIATLAVLIVALAVAMSPQMAKASSAVPLAAPAGVTPVDQCGIDDDGFVVTSGTHTLNFSRSSYTGTYGAGTYYLKNELPKFGFTFSASLYDITGYFDTSNDVTWTNVACSTGTTTSSPTTTASTTSAPTTSTSTTTKPPVTTTSTTTKPPVTTSTTTPATKTITAKAIDQTCPTGQSATGAHFVITGVTNATAPASINVQLSTGTKVVKLERVTGSTAHYSLTFPAGTKVLGATATIVSSWSGQFNLSHLVCAVVTPPTTSTSTSTTTVPSTTTSTTSTATTTKPATTTTTAVATPTKSRTTPAVVATTPGYNNLAAAGTGAGSSGPSPVYAVIFALVALMAATGLFFMRRRQPQLAAEPVPVDVQQRLGWDDYSDGDE